MSLIDLTNIGTHRAAAREAAHALASAYKEAQAAVRKRLIGEYDKPARDAVAKRKEVEEALKFAEERERFLAETEAALLAEKEAARAKAERQARLDAFRSLINRRTTIAERAEAAAKALGKAATELSAINTEIKLAAPALARHVNHADVKSGISASLYDAGIPWLEQSPHGKLDAQGRDLAVHISERMATTGANILDQFTGSI